MFTKQVLAFLPLPMLHVGTVLAQAGQLLAAARRRKLDSIAVRD